MQSKKYLSIKSTTIFILFVFIINIISTNVVQAAVRFSPKVGNQFNLEKNNGSNVLHYDAELNVDKDLNNNAIKDKSYNENNSAIKKSEVNKENNKDDCYKNYNDFKIAISGILIKDYTKLTLKNIKDINDNIPNKKGIYILTKNRKEIKNILERELNNTYFINEEGFLEKNNNIKETEDEYVNIINNALNSDEQIIVGGDKKWIEYSDKDKKIICKLFDENKNSIKFEEDNNRKLLILNDENRETLIKNLFNELNLIISPKEKIEKDNTSNVNKEEYKHKEEVKKDRTEDVDKKEDSKEEIKKSNDEDLVKQEQITENNLEKEKLEEEKHITKNLDIFDVGLVGFLGNENTELTKENIDKFKNKVPKGNGIWIKKEDREFILGIINKVSNKQYIIDNNGYLKSNGIINKNDKNSKICSEILDALIKEDKTLILGRSNCWNEYSIKEEKVINKKFTKSNSGVTIGGKFTNQLVIINNNIESNQETALVLFHELVHGLRGEEGKKDRLEEELFAGTIENEIRKELKFDLRDLSKLKVAYEDYNGLYRDDWNRIAFEYSEAYFGTVKLKDSSSSLNIRKDPSISSDVVGNLPHGTVVSIIDKSGDWYKINFNGGTGFIRGDFLALGSASGATSGTIRLNDPSSSLNMRSAPSTGSSVVGSLAHGTLVKILGTDNNWYKINYNGTVGYVRGDFLVPGNVNCSSSGDNSTGTITLKDPSSSLNVRSGPSTNNRVVGSLSHGTVVQIIGTDNNWYKISFNGTTGYVRNDFITKGGSISSGNGTVTLKDPSSSLNIRSSASTNSSVVGNLVHGTVVRIIGTDGNWYKIEFNGGIGYVRNDFITQGGVIGSGNGTIVLHDPSSSLNIRSGPSTSTSIVGSLSHGSVVKIIGTDNNWYKISFNGTTGYVRNDFVVQGGAVGKGDGLGTITLKDPSSSLNVRSGPSTNTSVVGSLTHGSVVEIIGTDSNWYKIRFNGGTGYVRNDFVTQGGSMSAGKGTGTIQLKDPSSSLNVRSGASISSSVVGSLSHGSIIQIIGTDGNWYKISFNGGIGYVRGDFVSLGAAPAGSGNTGTIQLKDPSSSLNVRSGPSTNTSVIGSLPYGAVVEIIGTDSNWYKIRFNGKTGYVRNDFIVKGGSLSFGSDGYDSSFKDGYIRYYAQDDPRYGNRMYSNHGDRSQTIANSACGATAFSIVVSTLNNIDVPPTEICRYAIARGCRTDNNGTRSELFSKAAYDSSNPRYNLNYQSVGSSSGVKSILSDNKHLVIASMARGHVTRQGHYIVLAGYTKVNGKGYFKVYDPHRWNENYIYDGEIIDTVKDDGFILLSERAIINEAQGYYAFSSRKGSTLKPSSGGGSSHSGSSSSSGHNNGSSSSSNHEKANVVSVTGNFLGGVAEAGRSSAKGLWDFIKDPIKGLKDTSECVVFLGKAIIPGTDANKAFAKMAEKLVGDVSEGNANENAKRLGRIVGEIALCILVDRGVGVLSELVSNSNKLEKFSMLVGKAGRGEISQGEIANKIFDGPVCFTGKTLITTEKGLIPIKDIKIGDRVYSKNIITGKIELKEVKNKFINESKSLVYIILAGTIIGNERIESTEAHPFFVKGIGWVAAKDLKENDEIETKTGIIKVKKTEVKELKESEKVYNLSVEDNHTYFVGQDSLLVHNDCSKKLLGNSGAQFSSKTVWKNGKTERIDVENPAPGVRAGQIHYHEPNNTKWYFDVENKRFYDVDTDELAPKKIQNLLKDKEFFKSINKALKFLGEKNL